MSGEPIETLHVASFTGNVGDNANHNGTRRLLEQNTSYRYRYTENEIRKYYQNYTEDDALAFDEEFVEQANNHDLVLIGSGNFFELWIEKSVTGTTIDMSTDVVNDIQTPIVFYGLGCDPYKGVPGDNAEKFEAFLDHILDADHCLVSVRNDGSISHIRQLFGEEYADRVQKIPDGGFFTAVDDHYHPELSVDKTMIALNVVKDMKEMRFPTDNPEGHSYESFLDEMAGYVDETLASNDDIEFVLMPHIYSDLDAISDLLERLENLHRRGRVSTAPYLNGEGSERYIFDTYRKADLAMGMRFHTNVCSIGQATPSIGFLSYPKVGDLYKHELDMPNRVVDIRQKGFGSHLHELTHDSLDNADAITESYHRLQDTLANDLNIFHDTIQEHLNE